MGARIAYMYDGSGRLVGKDAAGTTTAYTYDAAGRLLDATSPDSRLSSRYDRLGRVSSEISDGRVTTFAYDAAGRRIERVTPTGARTTYRYDAAGKRTMLTTAGHTLRSTHDSAGRELTRVLDHGTAAVAREWDALGRQTVQELAAPDNQATLRRRDYRYRPDGHVIAVDDSHRGHTRFSLDAAGRVTRVDAANWRETYAYDLAGNQTSAGWPDAHPHPTDRGERTYTGTRIDRAGTTC